MTSDAPRRFVVRIIRRGGWCPNTLVGWLTGGGWHARHRSAGCASDLTRSWARRREGLEQRCRERLCRARRQRSTRPPDDDRGNRRPAGRGEPVQGDVVRSVQTVHEGVLSSVVDTVQQNGERNPTGAVHDPRQYDPAGEQLDGERDVRGRLRGEEQWQVPDCVADTEE